MKLITAVTISLALCGTASAQYMGMYGQPAPDQLQPVITQPPPPPPPQPPSNNRFTGWSGGHVYIDGQMFGGTFNANDRGVGVQPVPCGMYGCR